MKMRFHKIGLTAICLTLAVTSISARAAGTNSTVSDANQNTAAGTQALNSSFNATSTFDTSKGYRNSAFGALVLYANTTGFDNVAVGSNALYWNTTGNRNIAIGTAVLQQNTTGCCNVALGGRAMAYNTTGMLNVAIGEGALFDNQTGRSNVAVGEGALSNTTNAGKNLALGAQAGINLQSGDNNIYIGNRGGGSSGVESDTIRIGGINNVAGYWPYAQNRVFISGISNSTVTGVPVLVTSDGQLGIQTSSSRYKQDIKPMAEHSDVLMLLKPVTFHYKQDPHGPLEYGLVAEDVAKISPDLVVRDDSGQIQAIRYQELTPMLINEVQKQAKVLKQKEAQILDIQQQAIAQQLAQQKEIADLTARLDQLAHRIASIGSVTVASASQ